jgi:prolipoprotein diacylglyceryl transferase
VSLAFIPSPHTGTIDLGPITIHMYGLMLLLAIAACIWLTGVRWVRRGGDWDLVLRVAVWGVAFGIIGARAYHDITSWNEVSSPKWKGIFAVWQGGLGVWGGILLGCIAGGIVVWRSGARVRDFADAVAPGLLLAQGIGRWGNWFNQELYGKPTDLPWALDIDQSHQGSLPAKYLDKSGYQPTFLYEFIYDLGGVAILLLVDRYFRIRRPALFALYVSIYTVGRFFEELLRIDPAHEYFGLRLNAYVSIVLFVLSTAFFIWWQFIRTPTGAERPRASRIVPEGPAMAVPKGRVRSGR